MTSDGYRVTLESVVRDAKEETRKEYEALLREKDAEIARLKKQISGATITYDAVSGETERLLRLAISDDYALDVLDYILDDVFADVRETADPVEWNEDDVRLAIGRVLLSRLGDQI